MSENQNFARVKGPSLASRSKQKHHQEQSAGSKNYCQLQKGNWMEVCWWWDLLDISRSSLDQLMEWRNLLLPDVRSIYLTLVFLTSMIDVDFAPREEVIVSIIVSNATAGSKDQQQPQVCTTYAAFLFWTPSRQNFWPNSGKNWG